ncbi:hypothetical protein WH47_06121 [Habropoda laboriosa]|uniref:Uncharacterized protein n=1 Tax=Habropoda laboriosa TaxID=597456 RepID=A0A0L7QRP8_9HYME|nr:hypothetical protein WH47_06121 [Habropoda laboriosa]
MGRIGEERKRNDERVRKGRETGNGFDARIERKLCLSGLYHGVYSLSLSGGMEKS